MHKVAIIGTGLMADIYAEIISQKSDCKLVSVAGNTKEKTFEFAKKYKIQGFPNEEIEALYASDPSIDVTIIATPEWVREKPILLAIKNQQNMLIEKPFAQDLETALRLANYLGSYSKVYEVCHVLRYSPRFCALKSQIEQGAIGEIRHIYARRNSNTSRVKRVLGKTDLAFWLAPHDIDMMRWITNSNISEVYAKSRGGLNSADDYLIVNLRFKNGVDAVLEISWCTPPISGVAPEAKFEVWGTEGSIELLDSDMNVSVYRENGIVQSPDTYEDYQIHGLRTGFFKNMIDCFIKRVKDKNISGNQIENSVSPILVCDLIRKSLNSGQVIRI
jgi:predicted dehydrogenase